MYVTRSVRAYFVAGRCTVTVVHDTLNVLATDQGPYPAELCARTHHVWLPGLRTVDGVNVQVDAQPASVAVTVVLSTVVEPWLTQTW